MDITEIRGIKHLIEGYLQFREEYILNENPVFKRLADFGQSPRTLIIACSDSRVDPALLMNCSPGDLFVVRNVANLVPPYDDTDSYHGTSAAVEYAVTALNVQHIIILGHSNCGGINSLFQNKISKNKSFIAKWMEIAKDSKEIVLEKHHDESINNQAYLCGKYSIVKSLQNLMTFPWIKERVDELCLFIHGWHFDMETGIIDTYDYHENKFSELKLSDISYDIKDLKL